MKKILLILFLPIVLIVQKASAQAADDNTFVPGKVVIFEDNFRSDSAGTFPKHWWIMHRDSTKYKRFNIVRNLNGKKALVIIADTARPNPNAQPVFCSIGPRMPVIDYLPEGFTMEFDFLLSNLAAMEPGLYTTGANEMLNIYIENNKEISYFVIDKHGEPQQQKLQLPQFNYKVWHHFAISYQARQATCYIDGKEVFRTPAVTLDVYKFLLGNWTKTHPEKDSVAYTNFRLATDNYTEAANFNRLLTEHTFTTHAIHFEINRSDIKPESAGFIKQLAEWLKRNPTVKLEIDGHTDSDGEAAPNMKLSQDRADEVKKQLVLSGIKSTRLTTKGYGATKPIRSNTTPEGKAENRRVEFIRK